MKLKFCLLGLVLSLLATNIYPAQAYLDPGSGSLLIQCAIGFLVAASFTLKIFWMQIKLFFLKLSGKKSEAQDVEAQLAETKKEQQENQES